MAAAAPPLLEAAAHALVRLLAAAAGALGGAAAGDAAKKKVEEAEKSKDKPIAKAETKAGTATCQKCPPDCGYLVGRNWNMSENSRVYQARITGFAPGTEWHFEGVDFDGFKSAMCLLLEAKGFYDQFFGKDGSPKLFFGLFGEKKIMAQARVQSGVVWTSPPALLQWHFQQPISFAHFARKFGSSLLPIQAFYTP